MLYYCAAVRDCVILQQKSRNTTQKLIPAQFVHRNTCATCVYVCSLQLLCVQSWKSTKLITAQIYYVRACTQSSVDGRTWTTAYVHARSLVSAASVLWVSSGTTVVYMGLSDRLLRLLFIACRLSVYSNCINKVNSSITECVGPHWDYQIYPPYLMIWKDRVMIEKLPWTYQVHRSTIPSKTVGLLQV